ncbi:MAG: hypothetical protein R2705_10640 [Ilumatobacteraceae bacterium]
MTKAGHSPLDEGTYVARFDDDGTGQFRCRRRIRRSPRTLDDPGQHPLGRRPRRRHRWTGPRVHGEQGREVFFTLTNNTAAPNRAANPLVNPTATSSDSSTATPSALRSGDIFAARDVTDRDTMFRRRRDLLRPGRSVETDGDQPGSERPTARRRSVHRRVPSLFTGVAG